MTATVYLANGQEHYENVVGLDSTLPGALRLTQRQAESTTASGLVARVGGTLKETYIPWHRILRVEVAE